MNYRVVNGLIIAGVAIVAAVVLAALVFETDITSNDDDQTQSNETETVSPDPATDDSAEDVAEEITPTPELDATPTEEPVERTSVSGQVADAESGEPLSGVTVSAEVDGEAASTGTTDDDGFFALDDVPVGAVLVFSMDGYLTIDEPLDDRTEIDVALHSTTFAGRVLDSEGQPIWDATVASGDALTFTGEDGSYTIEDIPEEGYVIFKAPGYHARSIPVGELEEDVTLEDKSIYGIYATAGATGDSERFTGLLDMIDRTELNAIVIDIKDSAGYVFHDTSVEMAHEMEAVMPVYDAESVVQQIKDRDIYAIARIVIFEDPVLAEARPDLAIQDSQEGGVWRTFTGIAWTNPYREEVWEYNIALMEEAVELGFDEIQLDYMRFPTDGPLNRADYGQESNEETRDQAIADFLASSYESLATTRAYLTGDIFGMTLWEPNEGGIGQDLVTVTEHLDYVHPMIYPSHFYEGSMGFDIPNNHPYEVIYQSLEHGAGFLPERLKPKIRPWLQDFSYGPGIEYGDEEVREQIRATEDFGASGWMLWNAAASYHEGALRPAE